VGSLAAFLTAYLAVRFLTRYFEASRPGGTATSMWRGARNHSVMPPGLSIPGAVGPLMHML
jgi:hypothetical protein